MLLEVTYIFHHVPTFTTFMHLLALLNHLLRLLVHVLNH